MDVRRSTHTILRLKKVDKSFLELDEVIFVPRQVAFNCIRNGTLCLLLQEDGFDMRVECLSLVCRGSNYLHEKCIARSPLSTPDCQNQPSKICYSDMIHRSVYQLKVVVLMIAYALYCRQDRGDY